MTSRAGPPIVALWLLPALLVALAVPARAQDPQDDDDDDAPPAQAPQAAGVMIQNWQPPNFEQWVFQNHGNALGARRRLDSLLALHIQDIDRACMLGEADRKKLQLAGRGDIKRFFDRYEELKRRYELIKQDQQQIQNFWREINPLQMTLQTGLFHEDSLLGKSLKHCVGSERLARYESVVNERRAFRHRANLELLLATFEQQGVPLRDQQRREILALLLGMMKPSRRTVQNLYQVTLVRLSRLPEEKLRPLFDDVQWKVLSRQLAQGRQMEVWLKRSGQLADDEDDVKK